MPPRSGLFDPDPCTFSRSLPFEVPSEGVDRVARFLLAILCRRGVGQHPGEELDELGEFGGFDFHVRFLRSVAASGFRLTSSVIGGVRQKLSQ